MSETQTVTAECGCRVKVYVKTEMHHFFDRVSGVEIIKPCDTHGLAEQEVVDVDPTEGMSPKERMSYWAERLMNPKSAEEFEHARAKHNELVDSLHPARVT